MEEKQKQTVLEIFETERQRLHKELSAIEAVVNFLNSKSDLLDKIANTESTYDSNWTYSDKIIYILKQKGSAFTKDIVEVIAKNEPQLNKKALPLTVGKIASRLVSAKKIKVEKIGTANKYSLG